MQCMPCVWDSSGSGAWEHFAPNFFNANKGGHHEAHAIGLWCNDLRKHFA